MGVTPDLVTLSKSISGFGLPMSLLLIKPEFDVWKPGEHNGTYRGNAHAFVTARVALEKFWGDRRFQHEIERSSALVGERLARIARLVPGATVKGRGMMQGIDVRDGGVAAEICRRSARRRLIIEAAGPEDEVIKILAPLTTSEQILNRGLDILEESAAAGLHAVA
jgi:diaminobutyrate-2-oxoglutarate transaminase